MDDDRHDDFDERLQAAKDLSAIHQLILNVAPWGTMQPPEPRRMAYDRLVQLHNHLIERFANS